MKIHTQARTTISGFILVTFLTLNSAIAYSQEGQKSNEDINQATDVKLDELPALPKKIELKKLQSKAKLAPLSEVPLLPTLNVIASKSVITKLKELPNKDTTGKGFRVNSAVLVDLI